MDGIKADNWFRQDYNPANPDDEESIFIDNEAFSMQDVVYADFCSTLTSSI